jgi:hypothetical protein
MLTLNFNNLPLVMLTMAEELSESRNCAATYNKNISSLFNSLADEMEILLLNGTTEKQAQHLADLIRTHNPRKKAIRNLRFINRVSAELAVMKLNPSVIESAEEKLNLCRKYILMSQSIECSTILDTENHSGIDDLPPSKRPSAFMELASKLGLVYPIWSLPR